MSNFFETRDIHLILTFKISTYIKLFNILFTICLIIYIIANFIKLYIHPLIILNIVKLSFTQSTNQFILNI